MMCFNNAETTVESGVSVDNVLEVLLCGVVCRMIGASIGFVVVSVRFDSSGLRGFSRCSGCVVGVTVVELGRS